MPSYLARKLTSVYDTLRNLDAVLVCYAREFTCPDFAMRLTHTNVVDSDEVSTRTSSLLVQMLNILHCSSVGITLPNAMASNRHDNIKFAHGGLAG